MITLTVKEAARAAGCNYTTMFKAGREKHVELFIKNPDAPADKQNPTMVRAESRAQLKEIIARHYPRAGFAMPSRRKFKPAPVTPTVKPATTEPTQQMGPLKFLETVPAEKRQVLAEMSRFSMERLTMLLALGQED